MLRVVSNVADSRLGETQTVKPSTGRGLTVGDRTATVVSLRVEGTETRARRAAVSLAPGTIRGGHVHGIDSLARAFEQVGHLAGESESPVWIGFHSPGAVVQTFDLTGTPQAEQEDVLGGLVGDLVARDYVGGWQIRPSRGRVQATVAAVTRADVEAIARAGRQAGLAVAGIELLAFSIMRALGTQAVGTGVVVQPLEWNGARVAIAWADGVPVLAGRLGPQSRADQSGAQLWRVAPDQLDVVIDDGNTVFAQGWQGVAPSSGLLSEPAERLLQGTFEIHAEPGEPGRDVGSALARLGGGLQPPDLPSVGLALLAAGIAQPEVDLLPAVGGIQPPTRGGAVAAEGAAGAAVAAAVGGVLRPSTKPEHGGKHGPEHGREAGNVRRKLFVVGAGVVAAASAAAIVTATRDRGRDRPSAALTTATTSAAAGSSITILVTTAAPPATAGLGAVVTTERLASSTIPTLLSPPTLLPAPPASSTTVQARVPPPVVAPPAVVAPPPVVAPPAVVAPGATAGKPSHYGVLAGGKLTLVGAVPDRATADALVAKAVAVLGAANVIDNYQIDPKAPVSANGFVKVADPVRFDFGSAALDPAFVKVLDLAVAAMKLNPQVRLVVVGHTDSVGSQDFNQALSEARALSAADYVASQGIDRGRIGTSGRSFQEPIADNETEEGRARNRRIEFSLLNLLG